MGNNYFEEGSNLILLYLQNVILSLELKETEIIWTDIKITYYNKLQNTGSRKKTYKSNENERRK
jgi:hypothetical protein